MRKTLNINLGGRAFIIDENAFELLHNYLEALKRKFNNEAEREEILNDIEARIGELLSQKLADRKEVVSVEEVQVVMDAMGKPEDIAGEESEPVAAQQTSQQTNANTSTNTGPGTAPIKKRLFRDAEDAKVAGVISGLCHYFGVNDPTWMRIAALALIPLTSGSIILLYLLLMIIVPKAMTSAEKLQMKGEPININTIEKEIKDAATRTGESVDRFMGSNGTFFEKLGGIIVDIIKAFFKFLLLVGMIASACVLISVCIGFVMFYLLGTSQFNDATHLLVDGAHTITYFSFGFLLFLGVPLIAVIYGGLKVFLGRGEGIKWLKWVLLSSWLLGLVLLVVSGYKTAVNFRDEGTKKEQVTLMQPANGTLLVQLTNALGQKVNKDDEADAESFNVNNDGVFVNGVNVKDMQNIPVAKPSLEIMASENDSFYMQEVITANGRNKPDANKNAEATTYIFSQTDTILNLNPRLYISKNGKWRAQEIKLRIAIPEGKKIRFAENIDLWTAVVKGDNNYNDTYFANTTWTVKNGKLQCIDGENHFNADPEKTDEPAKEKHKTKKHSKKDKDKDEDSDDDKDQDF